MYTEQPTPRNTATLADETVIEHFQWRESETDPWTNEAQLVENVPPDDEFPDGIAVNWIYFTDINAVTEMTAEQFKSASFPRKPIKRGGTPPGN